MSGARRVPSDDILLRRIARGDEEAFGVLVRRYEARFFHVASRILDNVRDAEDGVQLAFLRIHRKASEYRSEWHGSTWLYRILTNVCIDVWRKRGREPAIDDARDVAFAPAQERSSVLKLDLERALSRLSPEARSVVALRFSEDLSYDEIARVRGVSVNTIKTQLARARRTLRAHLKEESK